VTGSECHLLPFPKEHWKHLRTSNVVESPFAPVRLRTSAGKRYKKVENATALIWKVSWLPSWRSVAWIILTCFRKSPKELNTETESES